MKLALVLVAACSAAPKPTPSNTAAPSPLPVTDAPMDCSPKTEDAKPGNHDRFAFETPDGHYGYKDSKGNVVIKPTLRFGYEFKPGGIAAAVDGNGMAEFINTTGSRVSRAYVYDNGPDYFQEGFARTLNASADRVGFMSDRGVTPTTMTPRFDRADSFCGGKAKVMQGGRVFFIDRTGAPTDPPLGASLKFESDYVD